jgi:hypothetical protein
MAKNVSQRGQGYSDGTVRQYQTATSRKQFEQMWRVRSASADDVF